MKAVRFAQRVIFSVVFLGFLHLSFLKSVVKAQDSEKVCSEQDSFEAAIEKQIKVARAIKSDLRQGKKIAGRITKYNNIIKSLNALKTTKISLAVLDVNKKSSAILGRVVKNDSTLVKAAVKFEACKPNKNSEPNKNGDQVLPKPSNPGGSHDNKVNPVVDPSPTAVAAPNSGDWGSSVNASSNVKFGSDPRYAYDLQLLPANANSVVEGFYGLMSGFSSPSEIWNTSTTGNGIWSTPILVTKPIGSAYSTYVSSYTAKSDQNGGLHVFWVGSMSSTSKSCYTGDECTLYYNYRNPNADNFETTKALLTASSIGKPAFEFASDGTGRLIFSVVRTASGEDSYVHMDYLTDVYVMIFNGVSWSDPVKIETDGTPALASIMDEFKIGVSANGDYQILAVEFVGGNRTQYGGVIPSFRNLMHRTWPAGSSSPGPAFLVETDDGEDYETNPVALESTLDVFPDGSSVITWRQRRPYENKYGVKEYRYELRSKRLQKGQQADGNFDIVELNAPTSVGKVVTQSTVSGDKTVILWNGSCVNLTTKEVVEPNCIFSRQYEGGVLGPMKVAPRSAVGANLLAAVRDPINSDRVAVMSTEVWHPNGATYAMSYYNFTTGDWSKRVDFSEPYSNGFANITDLYGYNFLSALSNGKMIAFWHSSDTIARSNVFTPGL